LMTWMTFTIFVTATLQVLFCYEKLPGRPPWDQSISIDRSTWNRFKSQPEPSCPNFPSIVAARVMAIICWISRGWVGGITGANRVGLLLLSRIYFS
jgi:hypothetical protein